METSRLTDFDECRSPEEKEFALAILDRAEKGAWVGDLWFFAVQLILSVCAFDDSVPLVVRTVRGDFFGERVGMGRDPTGQLVDESDVASPGVYSLQSGNPVELAQFAADWLAIEMWRPIDLLEWTA